MRVSFVVITRESFIVSTVGVMCSKDVTLMLLVVGRKRMNLNPKP